MLDIQLLRNDLDGVAQRLAARGYTLDTAQFAAMEQERKEVQTRTQELQAKRNATSKQIGMAKSKGEDVAPIMAEVATLGDELKAEIIGKTALKRPGSPDDIARMVLFLATEAPYVTGQVIAVDGGRGI